MFLHELSLRTEMKTCLKKRSKAESCERINFNQNRYSAACY